MAILHSIQSGNFTDASTWGLVDPTSAMVSNTNSFLLTTANNSTQTFIPGAITVQ